MGLHNKRNKPRLLCAEIVRVTCADDVGHLSQDVANLDDASSGGACLLVNNPIPAGTAVMVTCHTVEFMSRVRHCTPHELGWLVGVEFDSDARWDLEVDTLGHLVDPARVGGTLKTCLQQEKLPDLRVTVSCIALSLALTENAHEQR